MWTRSSQPGDLYVLALFTPNMPFKLVLWLHCCAGLTGKLKGTVY